VLVAALSKCPEEWEKEGRENGPPAAAPRCSAALLLLLLFSEIFLFRDRERRRVVESLLRFSFDLKIIII
jgi:hypothetical protein